MHIARNSLNNGIGNYGFSGWCFFPTKINAENPSMFHGAILNALALRKANVLKDKIQIHFSIENQSFYFSVSFKIYARIVF